MSSVEESSPVIGPREEPPSVPDRYDDAELPERDDAQPLESPSRQVWTYPPRPNLGKRHRFSKAEKPEQEKAEHERPSGDSLIPSGP